MTQSDQEAQIKAHLEHVLKGQRFSRKPVLSRLLRYLVEETLAGKGGAIKEYSIGVDVFDRPATFRGGTDDSIVRSNMFEIRKELKQYYADEGATDVVQIKMSVGDYTPEFEFKDALVENRQDVDRHLYIATVVMGFRNFNDVLTLETKLQQWSGDPTLKSCSFDSAL